MPRYEGYHETGSLPFRQGQEIVIPRGVRVATMHPSRNDYVTKRTQSVKVHHFLSGRSVALHYALGDRYIRRMLEQRGVDLAALERDSDSNPCAGYRRMVHLENPKVCWPGTGGYWCEADINDLLEANGIADNPVSAPPPDEGTYQDDGDVGDVGGGFRHPCRRGADLAEGACACR